MSAHATPINATAGDDDDTHTAPLLSNVQGQDTSVRDEEASRPTNQEEKEEGKASSPSNVNDQDDEDEEKKDDTPHVLTAQEIASRNRIRVAGAVMACSTIAFFAAMLISKRATVPSPAEYDAATSIADIALEELVRSISLALMCIGGWKGFVHYGYHTAVLSLLLVSTKLWSFRGWTADEASGGWAGPGSILLAICGAISHYLVARAIDRIDTPPKTMLNYRSLLRILKPYFLPRGVVNKITVFFTWTIVAVSKGSTLLAPLFLASAVSKMTATPPEMPYADLTYYTLLNLIPKGLEEVQETLSARVWRVAFCDVAEDTFRHVHRLSLDWHLKKKMGNVLRAIDRGQEAAEVLMGWLAMWLLPNIGMAIASFVVFLVHFKQPDIAAICWAFLGFYCWMTYVVTMWRKKFNEEMNTHDNDMHDRATDALVNFETVKYFTAEEIEAKRYADSVKKFQHFSFISTFSVAVLNALQYTVVQGCTLAALSLAAHAVMQRGNGFDIGQFVALQAYLVNMFSPLTWLGTVYSTVITNLVNMQNLSDLLAEQPDLVDEPNARSLVAPKAGLSLEFKGVRFHYPAQPSDKGLHDVSFTVPAGTTTAIVGTTGSGKTTLLRLIFRFYDVLAGSVRIGNEDVRDVTQQSLRRNLGIVPQDTCMFNESLRHNILYGKPNATQAELDEAARKAQVYDFIMSQEKGWDTVVGERGLKLSGGEKQRVAIARCLLKDPAVVVLDEATSALDNKTEKEVQSALRCLEGRTTVVIAHRLTTVQNADQIIVMKQGRIVERGTHDSLIQVEDGEYRAMWDAQAREQQ